MTDALNSVIAQLNDEDSATVANSYAYSPYGESQTIGPDATGNPIQYTSRENDGTGLYFYRARHYDPVLNVFMSSDPVGLNGGLNESAYVAGNPVSLVDPIGLAGCFVDFPDFPITIPGTKWTTTATPGHAGVLGYDNATGVTRYYEYGRYGSDFGDARSVKMPNLQIGKDGQPTQESWDALQDALSRRAGKGTKVELSCDKSINEKKIYEYADGLINNSSRPPYSWKPWASNTCRDFAKKALDAGRP